MAKTYAICLLPVGKSVNISGVSLDIYIQKLRCQLDLSIMKYISPMSFCQQEVK